MMMMMTTISPTSSYIHTFTFSTTSCDVLLPGRSFIVSHLPKLPLSICLLLILQTHTPFILIIIHHHPSSHHLQTMEDALFVNGDVGGVDVDDDVEQHDQQQEQQLGDDVVHEQQQQQHHDDDDDGADDDDGDDDDDGENNDDVVAVADPTHKPQTISVAATPQKTTTTTTTGGDDDDTDNDDDDDDNDGGDIDGVNGEEETPTKPLGVDDTSSSSAGAGADANDIDDDDPISSPASNSTTTTTTTTQGRTVVGGGYANRHARYAHEHNKDPDWYKHEKHVLILTWSGRPVFTRYGDDSALAAYMGVVSAVISNIQRHDDEVRTIHAGPTTFVFVIKGPIYLISISRTSESVIQLQRQLEYVYAQIITTLTGNITKILIDRPSYDLRELMGGTENLLRSLCDDMDTHFTYLLSAYECVMLPSSTRQSCTSILRQHAKKESMLFALLTSGTRVVSLAQAKGRQIDTTDLLLIINFITNSQSLRSSESWTPICLPGVSDKGYLYAYVCYIAEEVCLTLISADKDHFFDLRGVKASIQRDLVDAGTLSHVLQASRRILHHHDMHTGIPEFRHFVYRTHSPAQFVQSAYAAPFVTRTMQKQLFRRYEHIHDRIRRDEVARHRPGASQTHSIYFEVSDVGAMLGWIRDGDFELYATFNSLVTKDAAITACNRTLTFIKRNESTLFIPNIADL